MKGSWQCDTCIHFDVCAGKKYNHNNGCIHHDSGIKIAHWVKTELGIQCDNCGEYPLFNIDGKEVLSDYCPWCGAIIESEEDE